MADTAFMAETAFIADTAFMAETARRAVVDFFADTARDAVTALLEAGAVLSDLVVGLAAEGALVRDFF